MKEIDIVTYKKILIKILKYIHNICIENDIKYSLSGGSLIGAVRNNGIIPWDDDIDMILSPNDYRKLLRILSKKNKHFKLLNPYTNDKYCYPFAKLIDTSTILYEEGMNNIDYGVYVDILEYHYVSNNKVIRSIQYLKQRITHSLLIASIQNNDTRKKEKNIFKKIRNIIADIYGPIRLKKTYIKLCNTKNKTNYLLSNWPIYGYKKEIQESKFFTSFKIVKFENIEAYINADYDEILTKSFGNYMELPPVEQRKSRHSIKAYYKK